jgi:hypothetical protein
VQRGGNLRAQIAALKIAGNESRGCLPRGEDSMNIAPKPRLIPFAISLIALAGGICDWFDASAQSNIVPAGGGGPIAGITARAPDGFYDPPTQVPSRPGALLRSEPLRDVALPAGMRGWRILYTTTVNDTTPATAVATVFASVNPPAGPRPVITWEHPTTGVLQKCMPSLFSAPRIPALDRIAKEGWVIVATDYSFTERGGPHPYAIGEGEARAGHSPIQPIRQACVRGWRGPHHVQRGPDRAQGGPHRARRSLEYSADAAIS